MKLFVQIPCFNEAETLPTVIGEIPRDVPGISSVKIVVIDDGSSDGTPEAARKAGATYVVSHVTNKGLARAFQTGIDFCLAHGADIIVNTDGDNQYSGSSIPELVAPIVSGKADVVVGDRSPSKNRAFSPLKRLLQRVGTIVVRSLSGVRVDDAVSGFRAYSREAALKINVQTQFSYTTETLIHVGQQNMSVVSVPVQTNTVTRPSRLFRSMPAFLRKQIITILRSYMMYRPLSAFSALAVASMLIGAVPIARFLYFFANGDGAGHIQSLILGSMFFILGYFTFIIALLSETIATNRRLLEATLERVRRIEIKLLAADDA